MSAPALRAAFWAALPAALVTAGIANAHVEPPPAKRGAADGRVTVGDAVAEVGVTGTYKAKIDVEVDVAGLRGSRRVYSQLPEVAARETARVLGEMVAEARTRSEAARERAAQIAEAHRLTLASGTVLDQHEAQRSAVSVTVLDGPGFRLTTGAPLSGADVEAVLGLLRERGVLPALVAVGPCCRHCAELLGSTHDQICAAVQFGEAGPIVTAEWCAEGAPRGKWEAAFGASDSESEVGRG